MKVLLFVLMILSNANIALASFNYQNHTDEFDQTKTKSVVGVDESGNKIQLLDISSEFGLAGNYSLVLIPNSNHICGAKDDTIAVKFLTVKKDGTRTDIKDIEFEFGNGMNFLIMGRTQENAGTLAYMFVQMVIAQEAMFRYVDECGTVATMKFNLTDFKKSIKEADFDSQ